MKSIYNCLWTILLAMLLNGCVDDTDNQVGLKNENEVEVSFHVSVPIDNTPITKQTSAQFSGNMQENMIQKIDILAFRVNPDGTEYFDYYAEGKLISGVGTSQQTFGARMRIQSYQQRFVVITNAHDEVMKLIGSVEWQKAPKDEMLKMLEFTNKASGHKWNASNTADFTPFPMWGEMATPELITSSTTNINAISMLRMVAKIDVILGKDQVSGRSAAEHFKLTEVYLYNVKDNGHVVPDKSTLVSTSGNTIVNKPTVPSDFKNWVGPLKYTTDDGVSLTDEIYTLEAQAIDLSKNRLDATGLVIGGYYSKDGVTWDTAPSYYRLDMMTSDKTATRDILRNHNYEVRIVQVNGPGSPTTETAWNASSSMDLVVADWTIQEVPSDLEKRQLNVSVARVEITGVTSSRIYFWSDQPVVQVEESGYIGISGATPFKVNDFFDDLAGNTRTSTFQFDPSTGEGYMDIVTVSTTEQRDTRRIYLNAGGLRREIVVNTRVTSSPKNFGEFPWVGTFHRSSEVGERIIYSDHSGPWSAEVDDPTGEGDFVILSKIPSDNKNLRTDSPGDAEDYPVLNGVTSVSGHGRIFFRVGMKSIYRPTAEAPARYATITIKYIGGTSTMYIRQGEGADYLMRPKDAPRGTSDITAEQRVLAKKFSPYNLTDESERIGRVGNATNSKYVFTQYPSQGGYYFQWGRTYAWYPDGINPVNWNTTSIQPLWEPNKIIWESSPPEYRRPHDGSTTSFSTQPTARESEIRQSLYLNPRNATSRNNGTSLWGHEDSDNSIWGYYADGFFDRRAPRESFNNIPATMVGSGAQLAYIGRLFYNPYTDASVFFPASGVRDNAQGGKLDLTGSRAYFMTTAKYNTFNIIYQSASPTRSILTNTGTIMALPIRSIKDE